MPLDMQSRAAKKLVLVCLAKVCQNDYGFECFPSRATMALAAERTERTIDAFLDDLATRGFIKETDKARRHRPRTWTLNVQRIQDLQPVATLPDQQDSQQVAGLPQEQSGLQPVLDRQLQPVDLQFQNLDSQLSSLDLQHVATERSERSYERSEQVQGADAPGLTIPSKDDEEKCYQALKRLAAEAWDVLGPDAVYAAVVQHVEARAADEGISCDERVGAAVGFERLRKSA